MNLNTVRVIADKSKKTMTEEQIRAALTQTIERVEYDSGAAKPSR